MTTTEELKRAKEQLENEIERLQKIIEASSETTFEIILDDLKEQVIENTKKEMWAVVKTLIKEVDSINGAKHFIDKQTTLLSKKKEELEEINTQLSNYQTSIFEQNIAKDTGYTFGANHMPIETGDVYQAVNSETKEIEYYIIKISESDEEKFAISGSHLDEELLMNYPKNRELIHNAILVGNIYGGEGQEEALKCLAKIQENEVLYEEE